MRNFPGTALSLLAALLCLSSTQAQTFTVLHTFEYTEGSNPQAGLTEDYAGNLYSTAANGGAYEWGTAFKITPRGKFTVLHSFGASASDAAYPSAPLTLDSKGNLYGTTVLGGDFCDTMGSSPQQCGAVFKITPAGKETVLHAFQGGDPSSNDGAFPFSGLVANGKGNFYGTTWGGFNGSVAYQITPAGKETVLYNFSGGPSLYGPLVEDASGDLWGTGGGGNDHPCEGGCGIVFRLHKTNTGWTETTTYAFTGGADGAAPWAGLVYDSVHRVFYGVTEYGGSNLNACFADGNPAGCGVLFKLDSTGTHLTVLHTFTGKADGALPVANLILDPMGDLYGTTTMGGDTTTCPSGCGTVFAQTAGGVFMTLHTFTGGADGATPYGPLLLDLRKAALYGTTAFGGDPDCQPNASGCGTVFSLTP
jgi:uncharacterized repeat protein (TIGR03803 family)